jgi:uncharacterized protein (DUF427 family)
MKTIGPDHPIQVSAHPRRVRVLFHDHLIADSRNVLVLKEAGYKPVYYFPRDDVAMAYMARTDRTTHCPYKGDASYYTLRRDGQMLENAVWTYESPFDQMSAIKDRLAFYPNLVDIYEVDDAGERIAAEAAVDDAILHTDSGAGTSQREHWEPNVSRPGT